MTAPPLIAFLSDYGLDDPFVGLCHAVVAGIAPAARVLDLCHAVRPQAVLQGALLLHDALAWLPAGAVVLAVVDPGVGSARRALVVSAGGGERRRLLVGPDNGLLVPAAEAAGGVTGAWVLPPAASGAVTFDGRDVFAPAAARLAAGARPEGLGEPVPPDSLASLVLPRPEAATGLLRAVVGHVDRFGNLQLLAQASDLGAAGLAPPSPVTVSLGTATGEGLVARVFADVPPGQLAVLPDAFGRVQVAVNQGSAAGRFGADLGDVVAIRGTSGRQEA